MFFSRMKRPIAFLLVFAMIFSPMAFSVAYATTETEVVENDTTTVPQETPSDPTGASNQTDTAAPEGESDALAGNQTQDDPAPPSGESDGADDASDPDDPASAPGEELMEEEGVLQEEEPADEIVEEAEVIDSSWELRRFVRDLTIFDLSGGVPVSVNSGVENLYADNPYQFVIEFGARVDLQFAYNRDGRLVYQLPGSLLVAATTQAVPIKLSNGNTIGWYTIDSAGLVQVWFDDVDQTGVPTADGGNFIDLAGVRFSLEIDAEIAEGAIGSVLDFGSGLFISTFPMLFPPVEGLFGAMGDFLATAAGLDSSDLADFVTNAQIFDMSSGTPVPIGPGDPTYIGNTYQFVISFAETTTLQFGYNSSGVMTYQLPAVLSIPNAILQTPIRFGGTGAIIGWYSIDTSGLVQVQFYEVLNDGTATPGTNWIDNYTNASITLDIMAQLQDVPGGNIDFGNGEEVTITPPIDPPASLTMQKTSRYVPGEERIYYMITITALQGSVTDITLEDTMRISGIGGIDFESATLGFHYGINGDTFYTPMVAPDFVWDTNAAFSYDFGALVLGENEFITVLFWLDLSALVANNPSLGNVLAYKFTVNNLAVVNGDDANTTDPLPPVSDDTVDPVEKDFPISKSGTYVPPAAPGDPYRIRWTITIGNGQTSQLNGGTITDTLGADLFLPDPTGAGVAVSIYDNTGTLEYMGSGASLSGFLVSPGETGFTFVVPSVGDPRPSAGTFGGIYQIVISFYTEIQAPPHAGQPGIVYTNNVGFDDGNGNDFGTVGRVPFTPAPANISKTTSGICGRPGGTYYVNYTVTVQVPAGLLGEPLYLHDVLSAGGSGVANQPLLSDGLTPGVEITAVNMTTGAPLIGPNALLNTNPIVSGNTWRMYFGTTLAPADGGFVSWQYNFPVMLTLSYRINIAPGAITTIQGNAAAQLTNAVYLINSSGNPQIGINSVAGVTVSDSWPIFKSGAPSPNPSVFNYVVTIRGGYSPRPQPLLQAGKTPIFTDNFDPLLEYLDNSFYVVDTGTGNIYAPGPGFDVTLGASSFSVDFSTLVQVAADLTTVLNPTPGDWFAYKRNFEVHYQLNLIDPNPATPIASLTNTASIEVNPGECLFNNSFNLVYNPKTLDKAMGTDGSDLVHVEIVVNPDGSFDFKPAGSATGPNVVTAHDVMTNLILYMDTVRLYTQTYVSTRAGGVWDGVWVEVPVTYNTSAEWSVNVVSGTEVDFVIPNRTPVKIAYDALVTLTPGIPGEISNIISIYGELDGDDNSAYVVDDSQVGAGASQLDLRIFKRDPNG
ncbi:MAG: hypothetical protein FWC72_04630, partial [Oscillospiraceae bacterium]|nr:hypothetical protein [Oscillospiraceae bacterium]